MLKAYRELAHEGLVEPRPGAGTFVLRTLVDDTITADEPLDADLRAWLDRARRTGLDDDSIEALFWTNFRAAHREAGNDESVA